MQIDPQKIFQKIVSKIALLVGLMVLVIVIGAVSGKYSVPVILPLIFIIFFFFMSSIFKSVFPIGKMNELKQKLLEAKAQGKSKEEMQKIVQEILSKKTSSNMQIPTPTMESIKDDENIGLKLIALLGFFLVVGASVFIYLNSDLLLEYLNKIIENFK